MTMPPAFSTTWVIWLTARPPAGTSSRTVMEYDTLGTLATTAAPFAPGPSHVRRAPGPSGGRRVRGPPPGPVP
ncbi:hypothetical protein [Actinomadura madurae]|uniref:hypothetical protein n=1 Tax=Actinomadura madurae TaxID=1993 RepID=UPI0020D25F17|nr:hypothetical protein [Actinomadura madurae]MCP9982894.1 hypothetical protein [Actinomadura madurae]